MPSYYKNWDKLAKELEDQDSDNDTGNELKAKNPVYRDPGKP